MSREDPYFQFPLSLLRSAVSSQALIQDAVAWSLLNYGMSLEERDRKLAARQYQDAYPERDVSDENEVCSAVAAAAVRMGLRIAGLSETAIHARELHDTFPVDGMLVRLRLDIGLSARDEPWPLLKLKTLCAVYAGVGSRKQARLNHKFLRAAGAGYSWSRELDETHLIPVSSLRYWLEQLWVKNLFQMCLHGQQRWYSLSCRDDRELAALVKRLSSQKGRKRVVRTNDV
jgi:hypothetical protein